MRKCKQKKGKWKKKKYMQSTSLGLLGCHCCRTCTYWLAITFLCCIRNRIIFILQLFFSVPFFFQPDSCQTLVNNTKACFGNDKRMKNAMSCVWTLCLWWKSWGEISFIMQVGSAWLRRTGGYHGESDIEQAVPSLPRLTGDSRGPHHPASSYRLVSEAKPRPGWPPGEGWRDKDREEYNVCVWFWECVRRGQVWASARESQGLFWQWLQAAAHSDRTSVAWDATLGLRDPGAGVVHRQPRWSGDPWAHQTPGQDHFAIHTRAHTCTCTRTCILRHPNDNGFKAIRQWDTNESEHTSTQGITELLARKQHWRWNRSFVLKFFRTG